LQVATYYDDDDDDVSVAAVVILVKKRKKGTNLLENICLIPIANTKLKR